MLKITKNTMIALLVGGLLSMGIFALSTSTSEAPEKTDKTAAVEGYIGEIMLTGANFCPRGWTSCEGQLLPISQHSALFSLLGTTYGGDGRTTFGLPDLKGKTPVGNQDRYSHGKRGGGAIVSTNISDEKKTQAISTLSMNYCICMQGNYPPRE